VLLILSACGTVRANRQLLSPAARASLRSPRTVVALSQTVIGTSIVECARAGLPNVPYVGNGLIGLLAAAVVTTAIDTAAEVAAQDCETTRAQETEQAAWPVRDALLGHDSEAVMRDALTRALGPLTWLGTNAVQLEHVRASATNKDLLQQFHAGSAQRQVLLVRMDQWLTPDFEELVVNAEVWLLTGQTREVESKGGRTRREPAAAFHNVLVASVHPEGWPDNGQMTPDNAIRLWSQEGTARRALDTALDEVAQLLAYDLAPVGPAGDGDYRAPRGSAPGAVTPLASRDDRGYIMYPLSPTQLKLAKVAGFIERQTPTRKWVRLPTGELVSTGAPFAAASPSF